MKKLISVIVLFCSLMTMSAQRNVYVWHRGGSIEVTPFANKDSITFSIPSNSLTLSVGDPVNVSSTSMTAYYVLTSKLNITGDHTECGVCYSQFDTEPTTNSLKLSCGSFKSGTQSATINQLIPSRLYYYRGYVIIGDEIYYSPVKSFITSNNDSIKTTHDFEAVDLGISVKWASCNLGASAPEDYGDFYAWDEISPKSDYTKQNYKYYSDDTYTKYNYNTEDGLKSLVPDDDAATVSLGLPWRMPTIDEIKELKNKCTWNADTLNGVAGRRVIGPNGNTIFLPTGGYKSDGDWTRRGDSNWYPSGWYWSSTLGGNNWSARCLQFGYDGRDDFMRYYGYTIRPVCP